MCQIYAPEYNSYHSAKSRATNPRNKRYYDYGGRGIGMCDRWIDSFENFLEDMGPRPSGTTLDRIDNDKGYEPNNCRWATLAEQALNRRDNIIINYNGETKTAKEWGTELGINPHTIRTRILRGWTEREALETPPQNKSKDRYEYNGDMLSIKELSEIHGVKPATIRARLRDRGWTVEQAIVPGYKRVNKG